MKEILLVEDSDQDAERVWPALRGFGVVNAVRRLHDGVQAMEYLLRAEAIAAVGPPLPSILLLDIRLPGMTGFEILEFLQNRPAFAAMLKIVLSQIGDTPSINRAYALGAQILSYQTDQPIRTGQSHCRLSCTLAINRTG